MKIGIDIDEVVANHLAVLIRFYHQRTGKLIEEKDFHSYNWWEVWGISKEEAIKIDKEFKTSVLFDEIKPVEGAIESIKKLLKNNEVIMVTSRPLTTLKKTESWMKQQFGNETPKIIHSSDFHGGDKTKAEICAEERIHALI